MDRLLPILRSGILVSISAFKQEYHEQIKEKWASEWQQSSRAWKFEEIDTNFPFDTFRKRQYSLKRVQASLLMQVRSGHIPLNSYLHRIKKLDTKSCQLCQPVPGEDRPAETVNHYIFEC